MLLSFFRQQEDARIRIVVWNLQDRPAITIPLL